ncbi:MAG: hypothetical protein KAJ19_20120 [Gammaproteobacteria bacterium]|nr:hypothetical protein [Gammaproteobacteria bacterium]
MEENEINDLLELYFTRCNFNDECDNCGNDKHEQSWAKMTGCEGEVDYYLCRSCAVEYAVKHEEQNKIDLDKHRVAEGLKLN